jgi:Biotin-lipoyl like
MRVVTADVVTIAPDVSGYVTEVRVRNNQFVRKGESESREAVASANGVMAASRMGELSPDKDPHPREAQFGAVRWSDLLGAGRAQVLIWLRGLNLNLQAIVSSGIDTRTLLIVGSRSQQIWEDSERRIASGG